MLPVILGHTPAGASTHTLIHFAQGINSGKFRPFDYGKEKNMEIYGNIEPPPYELAKVTAPIALYWSDNDWLAPKEVCNFPPNHLACYYLANLKCLILKYFRMSWPWHLSFEMWFSATVLMIPSLHTWTLFLQLTAINMYTRKLWK